MDYRYLLYFERDALADVLEWLGEQAVPGSSPPTTVVLEDREVRLPFSDTLQEGPLELRWDGPEGTWDFMVVLPFEPDEAIDDFLRPRSWEGPDVDPRRSYDEQGRGEVGFIYLSVDRKPDASATAPDVVCFDFGTPGTSMSMAFMYSGSIRRAMVDLLAHHRGVYGLLDMEESAELFWLRGVERSERLPAADIPLVEIERLAGDPPTTPFEPAAAVPWSQINQIPSDPDQRTEDGAGRGRSGRPWWQRVFRGR
jgi:hypothetical protein